MLEAHANMRLWNIIIEDNVDVVIRLMFELFISTQKFGVQKTLQKVRDKSIIFRLNQLGDLIIMIM
jgi:DNA replication licensing factor MCM2